MVGNHITTKWRKNQVTAAHVSPYAEVGNHSNTHANHKYAAYYEKPDKVVEGFEKANEILGLKGSRIIARLPGRNTWRVGDIAKNDPMGNGAGAADKLVGKGYTIYGWDVEWRMNKNGAVETPEEMLKKIYSSNINISFFYSADEFEIVRQQRTQFALIFARISEEFLTSGFEFSKRFEVLVVQGFLLEEFPEAFDQIQIRRIGREEYELDA